MGIGGAGKIWFIIPVLLYGQYSTKWSLKPHARHNPFVDDNSIECDQPSGNNHI